MSFKCFAIIKKYQAMDLMDAVEEIEWPLTEAEYREVAAFLARTIGPGRRQ